MISPEEIAGKLRRSWETGSIARAYLRDERMFPMEFSAGAPRAAALAVDFSRAKDWIGRLRAGSKEALGRGYDIRFQERELRRLGKQSVPDRVVVETVEDALFLAGHDDAFRRFEALTEEILRRQGGLRAFLQRHPLTVLKWEEDWLRLLAVCDYFIAARPKNLYLRQLDIPGVDTKFIESRSGALSDLLGELLGEQVPTPAAGRSGGFERRFGLKRELPTVRFRILDPSLAPLGLTDLSVPLPEFGALRLPLKRVFIIENKMNMLCFPPCEGAIAVFGMGYGAGALAEARWLERLDLRYWGDLDTHGFAILDSLRNHFPGLRSFLMDKSTLLCFRDLWVREAPEQRFLKLLTRLRPEEQSVFEGLKNDVWGESVRLEQERISFGHLLERVALEKI